MLHIKICGVTRLEDALAAAAAGADAVGFNFCPASPRCIDPTSVQRLAAELPPTLLRVGVFVGATASEIARTIDKALLGAVQLHGEEPAEMLADLPPDVPVLKAFRMRDAGLAPLAEFLTAAAARGRAPDAVLIDAYSPHAHGGTGTTADWQRIGDQRWMLGDVPLILAGGLTPANVAHAVGLVRPEGVDTASGVETAPGIKDAALIRGFVTAARQALT